MNEVNEVYKASDSWAPVYKYRAIDRNFFSVMLDKELFFAAPESLNDPLDCQIDLIEALKEALSEVDLADFEENKRKTIVDSIEQLWSGDINSLEDLRCYGKRWGILSFSAVRDNALMWSHYADEHRGVCLGFDLTKITKSGALEGMSTSPMVYSNGNSMSTALQEFKDLYFVSQLRDSPLPRTLYKCAISAALSAKSFPWKYEDELRLIKQKTGIFEFEPTGLTEIIFGAKVTQRDRKTIQKLLKQPEWGHVKVYNLVLNSSCPTFDIFPAKK